MAIVLEKLKLEFRGLSDEDPDEDAGLSDDGINDDDDDDEEDEKDEKDVSGPDNDEE
jgi:hypothetical protein